MGIERQENRRRSALIAACLLLAGVCLLPLFFSSAQTENSQAAPAASPSPSPSASPSPSPTPVTGLHQWGAVTLFHGLPSDRVHAIAQDADGAMWFGTEGGLARFDGRRTQAISDPELPGGRVLALKSDEDGSLWIGTGSGAARFANGRFQQIKAIDGKAVNAIIAPERSHAVMATEQGMIYDCHLDLIASAPSSEGLVRNEPANSNVITRQLINQPLQSEDNDRPGLLPLTSLTIANHKLLAGSSSRGVLEVDHGAVRPLEMRPQAYFVRALEVDGQGQLWLGTKSRKEESGFYEGGDTSHIARVDSPTGTVTALRYGGHGDMWVGSDGRGVFHFTAPKTAVRFTFDGTLGGLRSDHVYAIFVDREAVVWFGTDRGVSRYDPNAPRVEQVGDNPESNFVRTLYQTSAGDLFCGTNRGLFVYDNKNKAWQPVTELSRSIIYSLAEDKSGRLLVGSASGFYIGQSAGRAASNPNQYFSHIESASGAVDAPGSVRAIAQFRGATYIATFGRGVERIEEGRARRVWQGNGADTPEAISLSADGEQRLFIGTTKGAVIFDGQSARSDPQFDQFKEATVRSVAHGPDGSIWFATSQGVFVCGTNGTNNACIAAAPNFDARSLVVNSNGGAREAWCATTGGGMIKILVDELGPVVSQLDVEQGLPSQNAFAVWPQQDNQGNAELLIGTNRGVVTYTPGTTQPSLSPTRIISKRIHQPDELRTGLNLEYPQNSLLLDVTAVSSRTFPEQFQYAFVLTDNKGKPIKQKLSRDSQFTMEGLKPGKYKATVRAFTKDLVSSAPLEVAFTVEGAPFPWTSTALAVLLLLAILALIWAIFEHRNIVRTSAALVAANTELAGARFDLANEAERERRRIARDLHDQTLADLRRLLLITDNMPGSSGRGPNVATVSPEGNGSNGSFEPAVFRKEIESVSNEIRRICEDLSPSVLDNVGLAAALEWALANAVAHLPAEKKFEYEVKAGEGIEEQIRIEPGERIQIYRIAQEVINNICRHSHARHVRLALESPDSSSLKLTIEDDGDFFAPNANHTQGRGLANIHARASLLEAEVSWKKNDSGGTVFSLTKAQTPAREPGQSRV